MTQDRDPFELLRQFQDPEPDPVVMNAVIAQSRDAYVRNYGQVSKDGKPGMLDWLRRSASWMIPAGAAAAAVVVAVAIVPVMMRTAPGPAEQSELVADSPDALPSVAPPSTQLSRSPEPVTDRPADGGTRMGMQPGPGQPPAQPVSTTSVFEGDGVRVGMRSSGSLVELYLPDLTGDQVIDTQAVFADEELELVAAFLMPEQNIVAIRFRVNAERFWRVYRLADGAYVRDAELSQRASDAADASEVERRLTSP